MEIIKTNLEFNSNMTKRSLSSIKRIILHNSGVTVLQTVETIHNYHKNTKGWAGIGYHFYVRKDGTIYEGRPVEYVGAHATNNNSNSIGVCFEGNFNEETMNDIQIKAGQELVAYLKATYNISTVQAHRDVNNTSCPGANFPFNEIANTTVVENPTAETKPVQSVTGDETIRKTQQTLNQRYNVGLVEDGYYGPKTKKGLVKGLQTELNNQYGKGLNVDGIWGPKTKAACINVRQGAKGNITYLIQSMLHCKGYNTNGVDGIFGKGTTSAVRKFQSNMGISVDGVVGKNTFEKLFK